MQTKQHKSKYETRRTSGLLEKFLDSSSASTSSKCSDKENVVASELALTYHTVKHNLSYNSMDCTIKLNEIIYANSPTANAIHLARTKMEALVSEVLGPYSLQNVIDAVNTDNLFYCLQTDASNKKNIKLFPLVIQYFTAKNGIENKLIDFYENSNESADGMFEAIQKSLEQYKLCFHNVSGLSADNTNANFGVNHSLFTNMNNLVPGLIKGNCHAHIVHNCVRHAMSFLSHDIENVILKMYAHFSHSAVRREELKKFVASIDGDFHEIKRHVGTRWLSLLPCIDTLLLNWSPIRSYFLSLDNCPMVLQNLLMLNETENDVIEIYLHFCSHLLNLFNKAIKCLEGNSITILDIYGIMDNLRNGLTQRKQDLFFGYETGKKIKLTSPELTRKIHTNFLLFIDKALEYLNKWFDFNNTNWLFTLGFINLKSKIEFNNIVNIIENLNLQKLNVDMDDLYGEIALLNQLYNQISTSKSFAELSTAQKWQQVFKSDDNFLNLYKVISFLLSIPATSAFTERVFSVMNSKWRDERNKASLNLIKNELLIYFNLNLDCKDAVQFFSKDSNLIQTAKSNKKYVFKYSNKEK